MRFLLVLALLLPSLSHAALVRPETGEGRKIVHKAADRMSNSFVSQSEMILKGEGELDDLNESCERDRAAIIAELSRLDLSSPRGGDLLSAKSALEKAKCGANSPGEPDLRQANDSFFAATVYLRSFDSLN